eukprot:365795-Chlamydomonas_euryale.AAC.4
MPDVLNGLFRASWIVIVSSVSMDDVTTAGVSGEDRTLSTVSLCLSTSLEIADLSALHASLRALTQSGESGWTGPLSARSGGGGARGSHRRPPDASPNASPNGSTGEASSAAFVSSKRPPAVLVSRGAVLVSRGAVLVSRGAVLVSRGAVLVSRGAVLGSLKSVEP